MPPMMESKKDHYVYTVMATGLAAGAAQTQTVNVEANSDFTLVKIAQFSDIAQAAQEFDTQVIPLITLSIQDSGSGLNLQNDPVALGSIAGNGYLPFILPVPRLFAARSTISFTFTNFSAATTYNTRLALIGYKTFKY